MFFLTCSAMSDCQLLVIGCWLFYPFFYNLPFNSASAPQQLLLVQDGKLYGREPVFAVICKSAALPEVAKNHDIQKNEFISQLGQVNYCFGLFFYNSKISVDCLSISYSLVD